MPAIDPAPESIRVLIVEDNPGDAQLMVRALERAGLRPRWRRVESEDEYLSGLEDTPDVILADVRLPQFDGLRALDLLQQRGMDIPFVLVSGRVGEDVAVDAMKRGAYDYLLKDRLARLGEAVRRALEQHQLQRESARAAEVLRRSEERYRLISEITSDYAYTLHVDAKGALICEWATEAFSRMTGFSIEEVNARGWEQLYHPDDMAIAHRHYDALLSNRSDVVEVRILTKAGDVRWVRAYGTPIWDTESNEVTRICGAAQDLTTHRDLERQLLEAKKMEAIGQLAGGVAHDFNNLLSIITGHTELLRDGFTAGKPNLEHLQAILDAVGRASQLTKQLLAVGRRQQLQPKPLNLNSVVVEVEKMLRSVMGESIELRTLLDRDLRMVEADAGQMEQVIMNLVMNGRDAMPRGGQLIIKTSNIDLEEKDVRQHWDVKAGPYVLLTVSDSGVGMNREVQSRIFEPFFTTKEVGKGTGLGLATVHGIVTQSGGHIQVYSAPNQGSTFGIYLPALQKETRAGPGAAVSSSPGSETILVGGHARAVRNADCAHPGTSWLVCTG